MRAENPSPNSGLLMTTIYTWEWGAYRSEGAPLPAIRSQRRVEKVKASFPRRLLPATTSYFPTQNTSHVLSIFPPSPIFPRHKIRFPLLDILDSSSQLNYLTKKQNSQLSFAWEAQNLI